MSPELRKKIKSSSTVADNTTFVSYDDHSANTDALYEGPHPINARPGWLNNRDKSCFDGAEYPIRPMGYFKSPKVTFAEYQRKKPVTKNKSAGMKGSQLASAYTL